MDRAIIKTDRGFKITKKEESNVSISNNAVHIQRKGKPIEKRYNTGSVYLLIDCSGSMLDGNKMPQAKDGARKFLRDSISKGYSAGLIKFDTTASKIMEPQRGLTYIETALSNLYANQYGWTNMADGIIEAERNLINRSGYKVIVLVTDGQPAVPEGYPEPYRATLDAAESAKRNSIEIITIGTENADSDFLKRLSTKKDLSIIVSTINLSKGIESAANLLMICDK
jgi:Mg-chelatase subunit ChlD